MWNYAGEQSLAIAETGEEKFQLGHEKNMIITYHMYSKKTSARMSWSKVYTNLSQFYFWKNNYTFCSLDKYYKSN